ncbi:MAG: formyltransferase family protein, partial [Spirochaetota bacterium]
MAVQPLKSIALRHTICAVLTNPDTVSGRGRKVVSTPAREAACKLGIPVITSDPREGGVEDQVKELSPDILVVVAYGKMFRKSFLDLFPKGGINLHPS